MVNLADSRGVERRPQLTAARYSQSAERKNQKKEHHRQVLNNSGANFYSGSGAKLRGRFFLNASL
jgi:hypothetical protein